MTLLQPLRVIFILHQMGAMDHPIALARQLAEAGVEVEFGYGEEGLSAPDWVHREFPQFVTAAEPHSRILSGEYSAVVVQMPYDDHKAAKWRSLSSKDAFIVYAGYSVHMVDWEHGAHRLPFYGRCSLIMASSPFEKDNYQSSPHPPEAAIWSGDPLLWEVSNRTPDQSPEPSHPVILWTPHWTETWVDGRAGFSSWKTTVFDVLRVARRRSDVTFLVRTHPLLETEPADARSRRPVDAFRRLLDLPNVEISRDSMHHDMLRSTALLTDGVGIIAYYAALGKPQAVVRLGNRWPPYNAAGKALAAAVHTAHSSRSIRRWLDEAADGVLAPSLEAADLVRQLFPLAERSPGGILKTYLES